VSETLFMARIPFRGERLFAFAKRRGLKTWELDQGYAVHCALKELFGDDAPQPFALEPTTGPIQPVLGYGPADAARLRAGAQLKADPWLWDHLVDWDNLAAKPMPKAWREGQTLDFTVRATPIVRAGKGIQKAREGAEVDVFLMRCWERVGEPVDREAVYAEWFHAQLTRLGGARVDTLTIRSFQIDRLSRRHHAEDQRKTVNGRPDVTFSGTLTVTDPQAFNALVARGVGRHRAFGFGMLLLRPSTR
jgi:CRISPR system Cascade subunit CasE